MVVQHAFFFISTLGDFNVGRASIPLVDTSIPSLSSFSLNSPLSFYSPSFAILSHCTAFAVHPVLSLALPLLPASSEIVFAFPEKASLVVLNGLSLTLFQLMEAVNNLGGCFPLFNLTILPIKKYPNTNARQSQGIMLECRASRKGKNEYLPTSPFQRDTMQTKSMQEEVRGNGVI